MKNIRSLSLGTALIASSTLIAGCAALGIGGEPDERWADYKSWTKVVDGETGDPTKFIGERHGGPSGYRNIYVNELALGPTEAGNEGRVYPVGSVMVKEQYKTEASWKSGKPGTVMTAVKVPDDATGDSKWIWSPSMTGKAVDNPNCQGCHTIAAKHNFMFTGAGYAK